MPNTFSLFAMTNFFLMLWQASVDRCRSLVDRRGILDPAFHGADPVRSRRFAHREKLYFCPRFPRTKVTGFLLTSIVHQSKRAPNGIPLTLVNRRGSWTLALTRWILLHGLFSASSKRSIPSCVGNAMAFCLPRHFTKIREGTHTGTLSDFGETSGILDPAFHGADPVRSRRFAHREKPHFCPRFPRTKVTGFLLTSMVHQSKRDA